jgi:hypothetical protein
MEENYKIVLNKEIFEILKIKFDKAEYKHMVNYGYGFLYVCAPEYKTGNNVDDYERHGGKEVGFQELCEILDKEIAEKEKSTGKYVNLATAKHVSIVFPLGTTIKITETALGKLSINQDDARRIAALHLNHDDSLDLELIDG